MIYSYEKNDSDSPVRSHPRHRNRLVSDDGHSRRRTRRLTSLFDPGRGRKSAVDQAQTLTRPLFYPFTLYFKVLSPTTHNSPLPKMNTIQSSLRRVAIATFAILTIPFIAMQFTSEVNWTFSDFLIMGILIFSTGTAYVWISRVSNTLTYRLAVGTGIGTGFFLMWSNMAVGMIGSEDNLINMAYFGLIAVGFAGALVARFQPKGMTLVMGAIALGQMAIAVYALATGAQNLPHSSIGEIVGVTAFFTVFWVASALLFRREEMETT